MTETKSEWTPTHPKAIGWWVCADGVKRWVCGPSHAGLTMGYAVAERIGVLVGPSEPIRPYVETKKVEVEAWGVVDQGGQLFDVFTKKGEATLCRTSYPHVTVVRLTGTVEIEA